jgi:hypothetical protein
MACGCGPDHFHSVNCEWIETPMMSNGAKYAANTFRAILALFGLGYLLGERRQGKN